MTLNDAALLPSGLHPMFVWLQNAQSLVAGQDQQDFFDALVNDRSAEASVSLPKEERVRPEAILFDDDMLPVGYLERGFAASRSVARLQTPCYVNGAQVGRAYWGTGWLVSSTLLMTNHHVIGARGSADPPITPEDFALQAVATSVEFDADISGAATARHSIQRIEASDPTLDFALVRIDEVKDRPPLPVDATAVTLASGEILPLNIIQHPEGQPKKIAIRNNLATSSKPPNLRYYTSTLGGSSGSPVLNDDWRVVALHRGSVGTKVQTFQGRSTAVVNLGTQMNAIAAALPAVLRTELGLK
jgi:V8-like Glu-specific endopeptidase